MMKSGTVRGELEPCQKCGRLKSEYVDLGTKGYYECWWCTKRTAPPGVGQDMV